MTTPTTMTRIGESVDSPASRLPRGRRLILGRGEYTWTLMNRKHWRRLTQLWWEAGYRAGLEAGNKPLTTALRRKGA